LFTGSSVHRVHFGVPDDWSMIKSWLTDTNRNIHATLPEKTIFSVKCPEIIELKNYEKPPASHFWNNFPKNVMKKTCTTPIDIDKFCKFIQENNEKWSYQQKTIAKRAIKTLKFGSKVWLKKGVTVKNSSKNGNSAFKNGKIITDTLATWIKKGYVIGPYTLPPFKDINISPLMATVQKTKIRPILNLSAPEGSSLNEAVNKFAIRKLTMSSAKKFSHTLVQMGKNAKFAKSDLVDAYKLIPIHPSDWKYYGFKWLGKFFVDTTTPFGSNTAPANFDDVGETITNIVQTICNTPKQLIHRQLDDVPIVAPANSNFAGKFSQTYKKVCKALNIEMAVECKLKEKAFDESTTGTVLGIEFNSEKLEWKLPSVKWNESICLLNEFLGKKSCTLLEMQKLHGKINDFAQMCPFIKGFRYHQNKMLQEFELKAKSNINISSELKKELEIWKNVISDSKKGFPIAKNLGEIPIFYVENYSDAAGAAFNGEGGEHSKK